MSTSSASNQPTPTSPTPTELPSRYVPVEHEGKIWDRWLGAKAFHAQPQNVLSGQKPPYCIVIPPPNVTAALHLGHALNNTLQDILARQHRMMGFETLWMPGTDHAGIATQAVVEKRVQKEENKRRKDFTREAFVEKIQAFKDEYEKVITGQLQKMGCSCDWDRQRFTMDEQCARAVYEAFFRLFQDGLIYRGKRLVNWDPALQTAVADDECYDEEVDAHFYYLDYPLTESVKLPDGTTIDRITVATTRPETYLGDTGVAMNPRDPRAAALVGKKVRLPLINREIPIVADDYVVLPESMATTDEEKNDPKAKFATGFLKVTPAHDPNDAEIGRRHNLPSIRIMADDASISTKFGWSDAAEHDRVRSFIGLHREKSRKTIVKALEEAGFVREIKPYRHSIKFSDRSKTIIEPLESDQWYVKVTDPRMAPAANKALAGFDGTALGGTGLQTGGLGLGETASGESAFNGSDLGGTGLQTGGLLHSTQLPGTLNSKFQVSELSAFSPRDPYPKGEDSPRDLMGYIRNLPHLELDGATYFVTWRLESGMLSPEERFMALSAIEHWHGQSVILFTACVMPDHVHAIVRPLPGTTLGEWVASVKKFSSRQINATRGTSGLRWQDERFDHIVRDSHWLSAFTNYIVENPVKEGLVGQASQYQWLVMNSEMVAGIKPTGLETGATQGSETQGTSNSASDAHSQLAAGNTTDTGLETGATQGSETQGTSNSASDAHSQLAAGNTTDTGLETGATQGRTTKSSDTQSHDNTIQFSPARYSKTFEHWHSNIRDWCISRQLWWGHRIPVWMSNSGYFLEAEVALEALENEGRIWRGMKDVGKGSAENITTQRLICVRDMNDTDAIKTVESRGFARDPDVLDTWFSSALWPLSTLGWPSATPELAAFNPTSTLCTAREIITLWVSRMTMFNRYFLPADWSAKSRADGSYLAPANSAKGSGPIPFHDVVIHAVIQDGEGRKMSKSLGNGVDPLDIIESHGADAMRFTLCQMATQTQDVRLPVMKDSKTGKNSSPKFDLGRNFANKLWNAARFALSMIDATPGMADLSQPESLRQLSVSDKWMLTRLEAGIRACDDALANYRFNEYADTCYALVWNDFCDWYLEDIKPTVAKIAGQRAVLRASIDVILRLLHPVMPFVTESIYGTIRSLPSARIAGLDLGDPAHLLCNAAWPKATWSTGQGMPDFAPAVTWFERLRSLVKTIREVRAQHTVKPRRKITLHVPKDYEPLNSDGARTMVQTLADVGTITSDRPAGASVAFTFEDSELRVSDLSDLAAIDTSAERGRLEKLIAEKDKSIATLEGRLNNPGYALKAPPHMVQQTKDELAKAIAERDAARAALDKLA